MNEGFMENQSSLAALGHNAQRHSAAEATIPEALVNAFSSSRIPLVQRLANFPKYVRRQDLSRFLAKYELFQLALPVNGSVVECGVFAGGGLMSWYHFSAILEPYNHSRRVIGFDTFSGFPGIDAKDQEGSSHHLQSGAFSINDSVQQEIEGVTGVHDRNRPIGHISKIELVAGDATETIPRYVNENRHLLISLLYLDFDLYAPTKVALEHLLPRVVAGGVVAFDELNCADFPGETVALMEMVGLERVNLRRFQLDPYISYFIKI
jgi:hypothetical protein